MILGFTGHRPVSLPGSYSEHTERALLSTADFVLAQYKPTKVISGMALGWDLAVAQSAINRGIGLIAAVPFESQSSKWPQTSLDRYQKLLDRANQIEIISSPPNSYRKKSTENEIEKKCDIEKCPIRQNLDQSIVSKTFFPDLFLQCKLATPNVKRTSCTTV